MKVTRKEALARLPLGAGVAGLAPIGIPWSAVVSRRRDGTRYFKPATGCPTEEFAPTGCRLDGVWHDIE